MASTDTHKPNGKAPLPPGLGHNHRDLTDDEMSALVTSFTTKILLAQKAAAVHEANLKSARKVISGHFKLLHKETGYTRKEFERVIIANLEKSEDELILAELRERRLQQQGGLRSGEQLDLVERINDTVDDAIAAEAAGYRAGRRADDPNPPDTISTVFHPDWMKGWTRGQEVNVKAEAMAMEILARPKPGEMAAGEDPDEDEDELDPDAEAARLKASGWADPSDDEAEFDGGDDEKQPAVH